MLDVGVIHGMHSVWTDSACRADSIALDLTSTRFAERSSCWRVSHQADSLRSRVPRRQSLLRLLSGLS
eukprot:6112256-Prymnesium_polylepis.1